MNGRKKFRGEYLTGKKVSFYDPKHTCIRYGEVRLHQGKKLLILTKNGWVDITVDEVRRVYDGNK